MPRRLGFEGSGLHRYASDQPKPKNSPNGLALDSVSDLLASLNSRSTGSRNTAQQKSREESRLIQLTFARVCASDSDIAIRNDAANSLAQYGTSLDSYRVTQLLRDPAWLVRSSAVEAALRVLKKKAQPFFVGMLDDPHYIVRRDAAIALGDLGLPVSIVALKNRAAREKADQARLGIFVALFVLGEREFLVPLLGLSKSQFFGVRESLWSLVDEIVQTESLSEHERQLIVEGIDAAKCFDDTPGVR